MKNTLSILFILLFTFVQGQEGDSLTKKQLRKQRPTYLVLTAGLNRSIFRDLATSPLFYRGVIPSFSIDYAKIDNRREGVFGIYFTSGKHKYKVIPNMDKSQFYSLTFDYSKLYQIKKWSNEKWNYKIGGKIQLTTNVRINSILENNAYGYEEFGNLLFCQKLTRDISRKTDKTRKLWFIHYSRKPRKRELSCQFNFGVANNYVRNGYIYLGQSDVINNFKLFDGYNYGILKGVRMSSVINYRIFLKNSNAIQFSYNWDALATKGTENRFEMASHKIQCSLLFNLK